MQMVVAYGNNILVCLIIITMDILLAIYIRSEHQIHKCIKYHCKIASCENERPVYPCAKIYK